MRNTGIDLEDLARRCDAAFPPLDHAERRIALATYRLLAAAGPADPAAIAAAAGAEPRAVESAIERWPGVYLDEAGRVVGFWGLSLEPMDHEIQIGDRTVYGWCAWDTLFLPEILAASVRVRSTCPATGREVSLRVGPAGIGELDPTEAVGSMVDPGCADVAGDRVLSSFCHHIRFLASADDGERWARDRDHDLFLLTVRDAWELGKMTNRLRYGGLLDKTARGTMPGGADHVADRS